MPIRIYCPACEAPNSVPDSKRGQKVRCKECDKLFPVPAANGKSRSEEGTAIQSGKTKMKPKARVDEEEDDDRPVRKPKKEPAKGSSSTLLIVGGVGALLLACLVCGGGGSALFLFRSKPAEQVIAAKVDEKKVEVNKEAPEKKDNVVEQKDPPDPDAGKALPAQLEQPLVAKVKKATVYLHVTMPSGVTAEGSGFFALRPGIVVTNAHVLGMLSPSSQVPQKLDVVQDSGLPTEARMQGQVLGVDRVSDLAIVRVQDNGKLPEPLLLAADVPSELQKVYVFGFPFGEKLGKNITISEQAVSRLAMDNGDLDKIQINGGMNPGNSGGPVVNTRGKLVGVSVSIITGAQISFAVPADKVRRVMDGRFVDHQIGDAYQLQGQTRMPVRLTCLDPLGNIKSMRVEVWTGPAGGARAMSDKKPQPTPGDGPRQEHVVQYANGVGTVEVPLPPLPGGHVYWVRPVLTSTRGTHWGAAQPTDADFAIVERKPANLTVDLTKHRQRSTKVDSRLTITETFRNKENKESIQTLAETLEMVEEPVMRDGKRIANIKTAFGPVNMRLSVNGKNIKLGRDELDTLAIVRGMPPTFVIDDTNTTSGYLKTSINPKHPKYYLKNVVELFNGFINNPYEATQFKMPNRVVQPQEEFPSSSTMMMRLGSGAPQPKGKGPGRAEINDLKLTCTYQGVRVRNGREEAVLTVVGTVISRKFPGRNLGNVTGKIGFDTAGGFVSYAKIRIYAESEDNVPGLGTFRDSLAQDIDLDRTPGNRMNIVANNPPPNKNPPPDKNPPPTPINGPDPVPGGAIANPAPKELFKGDVTLRHLPLAKKGIIVNDIVWSKDAKAIFMLFDTGLLQRINVETGQTEQHLEIGVKCGSLSGSGEGLVVAVTGLNQLWVIDPDKLANVKKKVVVATIARACSGLDASVAWAGIPNPRGRGQALRLVDLKTGGVQETNQDFEIWVYGVSPDGKYVGVANDDGLSTYRINGATLTRADASHRIGGNNTRRVCFSTDSKYVAMPAGGGNGNPPNHNNLGAYATYIYSVDQLKRPATGYAGGAYPRAVGIDTKSNLILAQNHNKPLVLYSFAIDSKVADYDFKGVRDFATTEFSMSPLGSEAIARSEKHAIVHIKINKPGPAFKLGARLQGPLDVPFATPVLLAKGSEEMQWARPENRISAINRARQQR